jgi:hypothetical protein
MLTHPPQTTWANGVHPLSQTISASAAPHEYLPTLANHLRPSKPLHTYISPRKAYNDRAPVHHHSPVNQSLIANYLLSHPNSTTREIATALDATPSNISHQLADLVHSGIAKRGARKGYPRASYTYTALSAVPARPCHIDSILQFLADNPGSTASQIQSAVHSTHLYSRMRQMEVKGEVVSELRVVTWEATPGKRRQAVKCYSLPEITAKDKPSIKEQK